MDNFNKINQLPNRGEELEKHICYKGLVSRIHKEPKNSYRPDIQKYDLQKEIML